MNHNCQTTFAGGVNPFLHAAKLIQSQLQPVKDMVKAKPPAKKPAITPGTETYRVYHSIGDRGTTSSEVCESLGVPSCNASHILRSLSKRGFLRSEESISPITKRPCWRHWRVDKFTPAKQSTEPPARKPQAMIFDYIKANPFATQKQIRVAAGLSQGYVQSAVERLCNVGMVEMIYIESTGNGPRKFYRVNEYVQLQSSN